MAKGVVPLPPALLLASLQLVSLSARPEETADHGIDVPWDRHTLMGNVRRKKAVGEDSPRGKTLPSGPWEDTVFSRRDCSFQRGVDNVTCISHLSVLPILPRSVCPAVGRASGGLREQVTVHCAGTLIKGDQKEPSESQTCSAGWP